MRRLKAVTSATSGQVAYIPGYGIYAFLEAPGPAEDAPWIIAPADGSQGRWYHPSANLLTGPRSFVTTTAANKLPADIVPNGLVATYNAAQTGNMPSMHTTPIEMVGYALTPANVRVGDIFHVDWQGRLQCAVANMWGSFLPVVTDDNKETQLDTLEVRRSSVRGTLTDSDFHVSTVWTAQSASLVFKAKFMNSGGGEAYVDNATIRALHFRP